ncbi:MAG TPA: hypothetical protein VG266_04810 [Candidatus Dormibacteraeota bacterium]|jgi:hypothetical protein|nr:hypothetical protein [Candidatus Dormibacteraeota bacterium]
MRPSPGLVLAALLVVVATQAVRFAIPGRGPYLWTLLLSVAGLIGGEILAAAGHLANPSVGVIHPLADAVVMAALQLGGAALITAGHSSGE